MKKLFNFIVCSMAVWAISSCSSFGDDKTSKETEEIKTNVEQPDSAKHVNVEQDVFMTELLNKVDIVTAELKSTKAENAELKEKYTKMEKPQNLWIFFSIGAFILSLVAFITALFKPKGVNEEKVYYIVEACLDDSRRIKELQVNVNNLLSSQRNNKTSRTSSSYAPNSDTRLRQLESQMAQVIGVVNKITTPVQQSALTRQETICSHEEHEYQKVGYAKVDTDIYFTTIYDSNQEGCVFKITFTSQSKGKFNIIALDKIQSRNDWQKKVECSGDISIKEASDFRLEEEGICEKIDDINWKITKPLKIRLLK